MTVVAGWPSRAGVSLHLHQRNSGELVRGQRYYTYSRVYPDRSRVHKGAQLLVSQPVGLSFNQSVSRSVGQKIGRLIR